MDIEPYRKYFTGKNPDLLGHSIIGIAAGLVLHCVNAPKPPPTQAFNKIAFACDQLDENTFEEICLWAFKIFPEHHIKNSDAAWVEIADLIERKSGKKEESVFERTSQGSLEPGIIETLPSKEFKIRGTEHISNILPRVYIPAQETPEGIKPQSVLVKKPFSLKIAMRLCTAWRLDPRWEKLTACAKLLFYWLVFRTYRKDTFRKIKQALAKGETYFPWCLTGLHSLEKQLTYHPKSSCRMKHYERQQIGRALRQLWDLGFIHRIFRGYEDKGAGKYHVFLNPKISARFHKSSIDVKRGSTREKRHFRMS